MENIQPTKTEKELESQADTLDASIKSQLVAATEGKELQNSSLNTTATMQNASPKIWSNAELTELKSKVGLVAGALADFQAAGGLVAVKQIPYQSNGINCTATKLILVADGLNLVAVETADGLDFSTVAVNSPSDSQPE